MAFTTRGQDLLHDTSRRISRRADPEYRTSGQFKSRRATAGRHEETREGWLDWRALEAASIRNCRRGQPIYAFGYSISPDQGGHVASRAKRDPAEQIERDCKYRVRVQISRSALARLRGYFLANALRRDEAWFSDRFWRIPFEPYAPVRKQLLELLRQVNAVRNRAGLNKISIDVLRYHRRPVRVFNQPVEAIRVQPSH